MIKKFDRTELEEARDLFLELATIVDDMINIQKREDEGEDVKAEAEMLVGRFVVKTIELSQKG